MSLCITMTINKHLSSQPHIGGGALPLNQQQNSERRNRGLSLLNQTAAHCISPSECCNDYCSNDSFNEINLQLHASSVSNPYRFSISSNTTFSANARPALPEASTKLLEITEDMYPSISSFRAPAGCKVVLAYIGSRLAKYDVRLYCQASQKTWVSQAAGYNPEQMYIGVTPGKDYTIILEISDSMPDDNVSGYVYYSAEINTHTPDVTDY